LYLERMGLAVHSELNRDGRATGRFTVFSIWPTAPRYVTSYMEPAYDWPHLAFIAEGRPAVVLLSSYTGGLGRDHLSNYDFKLLVLFDSDSAQAFSLVPPDSTAYETADVLAFSRTVAGGFTFQLADGNTFVYREGRLTRP
jgi:hypothetical protein